MNKWLIIIAFLFFFSCQEQTIVPLPIEEEKLVAVVADLHLAEAAFQNLLKSQKDSLAPVYYAQVYEMHHITKAQLDSSLVILSAHPKRMVTFYEKVQEVLSKSGE